MLYVPILGYPDSPGNSLSLEILDDARNPAATVRYRGVNPREHPDRWDVRVSPWRGRTARLVLTDGQTTPGGWLAVAAPIQETQNQLVWLDGVPRRHGWRAISALALTGLISLPGLAWRTWWPQRFPTSITLLPLPGLLILTAGQLSVALAVPRDLDLTARLWLAGQVALAGTLTFRWSRHGDPLTKSEFCQLGVYGCVAIGMFLLTLPF